MLRAASYPEMFVLGTFGETGRRQLQIFNQFDGCCFRGLKGKMYEEAVRNAASQCCGGRFDVTIDRTHTRHAISRYGRNRILRDMARRGAEN